MVDSISSFLKQERLLKRRQYLQVYDKGFRIKAKFFFVFFLENNLPHSRLGLTVSRKVGKTIIRNRIKRRLREIFRKNKHLFVCPADLVINATRETAGADFRTLEEEFLRTIERWRRERQSCRPEQ